MYPDGVCRVTDRFYSKTIQYQDINYQLAQAEDQEAIFELWCEFLNYADSSMRLQFTFFDTAAGAEQFGRSIYIAPQDDYFNSVRTEYSDMLYIDRVIDRVDRKLMDKLPKMDIMFKFPNLYPGTRTVIVLKQPKTDGSIRNVYTPETVSHKLMVLKRMQDKLKQELGDDGYMDYGLMICQANGRPIMTEHLNKRFKDVLIAMGDPDINVDDVVFHSIRHTSAGVKLRLSKGDLKAVQGDGGWNTPDMVTKRYAHILDEDRRNLATEMEAAFYQGGGSIKPTTAPAVQPPASIDVNALASMLSENPALLMQIVQSVQSANRA